MARSLKPGLNYAIEIDKMVSVGYMGRFAASAQHGRPLYVRLAGDENEAMERAEITVSFSPITAREIVDGITRYATELVHDRKEGTVSEAYI